MQRGVAIVISALGGTLLGAAVGVLIVKARPRSGMGWDQIADGLGALALGGLLGCLAFGTLSAFLSRRRALVFGVVLLVLGPVLLVLAARAPSRPAPEQAVRAPFEPTFMAQMFSRIALGDPGPPPGVRPFAFRELRVDARTWTLTSKGWGPAADRRHCSADLDQVDLERLAESARRVFDQGVENCPGAGSASFSVHVEWMGETRGAAGFGLACRQDQPAMEHFLATFEQIHDRLCT